LTAAGGGDRRARARDRRVLSNFAFSFAIISVMTGITTLYSSGLTFGGPATITFGWFVAGAFTMTVGLSMAEVCSSFPTSGGLYYWSARLSGKRWAPFASWITGWYVRPASIDSPSPPPVLGTVAAGGFLSRLKLAGI
jgi:amino acid transporter